MVNRFALAALVAAFALAMPSVISAQSGWRLAQSPKSKAPARKAAPPPVEDDVPEVEELTPGQIRRAQEPAPLPGRAAPKAPAVPPPAVQPPKGPKQALPAQPRVVACNGVFAKDTSHLKLATAFSSDNVAFGEVDGPGGARLKASVLFPKEPRRRLEVLWLDEGARSGVFVIAINGQSGWTGPKGLALRMPLASLERVNGKPFKLTGLDKDNHVTVTSWDGGGLATLPGGCQVGIRLAPDARTSAGARAALAATETEFVSTDPKVRALRLAVVEILVGY